MWAHKSMQHTTYNFETMMIKVISKDKLWKENPFIYAVDFKLQFIIYYLFLWDKYIPSFSCSLSLSLSLSLFMNKKGIKRSMLHKWSFNFYAVSFFFVVVVVLYFHFYDKFAQSPTLLYCCFLLLNGHKWKQKEHKPF